MPGQTDSSRKGQRGCERGWNEVAGKGRGGGCEAAFNICSLEIKWGLKRSAGRPVCFAFAFLPRFKPPSSQFDNNKVLLYIKTFHCDTEGNLGSVR